MDLVFTEIVESAIQVFGLKNIILKMRAVSSGIS